MKAFLRALIRGGGVYRGGVLGFFPGGVGWVYFMYIK